MSATLLIPADILTNPAFTVLGRVFNYPDVRAEPVDCLEEALGRRFRTLLSPHQSPAK